MVIVKKWGLKIYNKNLDKNIPASAWYVGRPGPFGNPWAHVNSPRAIKVKDVETAIKKYKKYVTVNLAIGQQAKRLLKGKDLVCWCVTDKYVQYACHAEIIMELANGK